MPLTATQITKVRQAIHEAYSQHNNGNLLTPWGKADIDAAIADADGWLEGNQTSYNNSLLPAFRDSASAADKALLLIAVAVAQRLVSSPEHVAVLRTMLAELADVQGA